MTLTPDLLDELELLQSRGTATGCACGSLAFGSASPHFHVMHSKP